MTKEEKIKAICDAIDVLQTHLSFNDDSIPSLVAPVLAEGWSNIHGDDVRSEVLNGGEEVWGRISDLFIDEIRMVIASTAIIQSALLGDTAVVLKDDELGLVLTNKGHELSESIMESIARRVSMN